MDLKEIVRNVASDIESNMGYHIDLDATADNACAAPPAECGAGLALPAKHGAAAPGAPSPPDVLVWPGRTRPGQDDIAAMPCDEYAPAPTTAGISNAAALSPAGTSSRPTTN